MSPVYFFSSPLYVLLLLAATTVQAYPHIKVEMFKKNDNSQSLKLAFSLNATPDCVLEVLFDYRHVAQVSDTVDSVELIETTDSGQVVRYRYDGLFYNYEAKYYRWPDRERAEIRYQLINYKQSGIPLPLVTSSSGRYTVSSESHGARVTLSQEIGIEQSIFSSLYLNHAYDETINFAEDLVKHIQIKCKNEAVKEVN